VRQRRLGKQPPPLPEWEYELRGIVVHSGKTMDSGHYFSIIRDPESHLWYKFDDRDVAPFPEEHLNESHSKFIGECYMLLFQKVSESLTSSQAALAANSTTQVDRAILQEVEASNASVVGQRRFLEMPYFKFLLDIMTLAPQPVEPIAAYPEGVWKLPRAPKSVTTSNGGADKKPVDDKGKEEASIEPSAASQPDVLAPFAAQPAFLAAQVRAHLCPCVVLLL
jgi:hypothetical protein